MWKALEFCFLEEAFLLHWSLYVCTVYNLELFYLGTKLSVVDFMFFVIINLLY